MSRLSYTAVLSALVAVVLSVSSAAQANRFSLSSPTLADQGFSARQLFDGFGCTGQNISPALAWKNAPAGTQSFAVTLYDPDAPTGSGWWHWVVYNIPANAQALPENASNASSRALPPGSNQGRTDFGSAAYGGPCPPAGDQPHRYVFTLHALKTAHLDLPADASPALIGFMIHANIIEKTSITYRYGRPDDKH